MHNNESTITPEWEDRLKYLIRPFYNYPFYTRLLLQFRKSRLKDILDWDTADKAKLIQPLPDKLDFSQVVIKHNEEDEQVDGFTVWVIELENGSTSPQTPLMIVPPPKESICNEVHVTERPFRDTTVRALKIEVGTTDPDNIQEGVRFTHYSV